MMMSDSGRASASIRRAHARGVRGVSRRRLVACVASAVLAGTGLAACSSANAGTGPVTLNFYFYPDSSPATQDGINNCNAQNGGTYKAQAVNGTLVPALNTAIWNGTLYAVPDNSNTQLLWYRSDLVPNPPTTWAQMISDAEQLAKEGKPHYIEIQGAQYEGSTVWFNTMVSSANGTILNQDATKVTLGAPAVTALSIMKELANSVAADPSLSVQMENQNRLAMEGGTAAFELNYPFVYPAMKADNPTLFKSFKWALYPEVIPGVPAKVTI